jgi:hypothetical protein
MIVTVSKYLNKRSTPSTDSFCSGYWLPGQQVEIVEVLVGKCLDGNCIWYKTSDNYYCWSGGILEQTFLLEGQTLEQFDHLAQLNFINSFVLQNYQYWKKTIKGLEGISVGSKYTAEQKTDVRSVIFLLTEKKPVLTQDKSQTIPKFFIFRGVRIYTDVVQEGLISASYVSGKRPFTEETVPMRLGGSIERENATGYGTRTLKVKRQGQPYVMTCYHVLALGELERGLYAIEEQNFLKNRNCKLPSPKLCDSFVVESTLAIGKMNNYYEYALAKLDNPAVLINSLYKGDALNGYYKEAELREKEGMKVSAFGATSRDQTGTITNTVCHPWISYGRKIHNFYHLIQTTKISTKGDSGAPVVDEQNKLLGFVIADSETSSYIVPIERILVNNQLELL